MVDTIERTPLALIVEMLDRITEEQLAQAQERGHTGLAARLETTRLCLIPLRDYAENDWRRATQIRDAIAEADNAYAIADWRRLMEERERQEGGSDE